MKQALSGHLARSLGMVLLAGLVGFSLAGCLAPTPAGSDALAAQTADGGPRDEAPQGLRAEPARPERPAPSLPLVDQNGQPWSLDQARGQAILLFFGYTHCPDYCPQTLSVLGQLRRELGAEADRLRVVMVSADPERDRPEVLAAYLGDHAPGDIGLTGDLGAVTLLADAFGAAFHKDPVRLAGGAPADDGDYTVTHTGRLYLIDPQGQIRGSYLGALSTADLAHDLHLVLGVTP